MIQPSAEDLLDHIANHLDIVYESPDGVFFIFTADLEMMEALAAFNAEREDLEDGEGADEDDDPPEDDDPHPANTY